MPPKGNLADVSARSKSTVGRRNAQVPPHGAAAARPTINNNNNNAQRSKKKQKTAAERDATQQSKFFRLPSAAAASTVATPAVFRDAIQASMLPVPATASDVDASICVTVRGSVLPGVIALSASAGFPAIARGGGSSSSVPVSIAGVAMTAIAVAHVVDDNNTNNNNNGRTDAASVSIPLDDIERSGFAAGEIRIPFGHIRKHLRGTPRFNLACDVRPQLPPNVGTGVPASLSVAFPATFDLSAPRGAALDAHASVPRSDSHLWLGSPPEGAVLTEASAASFAKGMCRLSSEAHTFAARAVANRRVARVLRIAQERHIGPVDTSADSDDAGTASGADRRTHAKQASRLRSDALKVAAASSQALLAGKASV